MLQIHVQIVKTIDIIVHYLAITFIFIELSQLVTQSRIYYSENLYNIAAASPGL